MGGNQSKAKHPINNKIIPKEYKNVKIVSFNTNLKDSIGIAQNIQDILKYIFESSDTIIDVIAIQGIHDYYSMRKFIIGLKTYCDKYDVDIHTVPSFDDIYKQVTKNSNIYTPAITIDTLSHNQKLYDSIIISRHKIINFHIESTQQTDIYKKRTFIVANILIAGKSVSIYDISLSPDIGSINSHERRNEELRIFDNLLALNEIELSTNNTYAHSDIHLLLSSLNINDKTNLVDDVTFDQSNEYTEFMSKYHAIDLLRHKYGLIESYTTNKQTRVDYVCLLLTKDIYSNLVNLSISEDFLKLIVKRYKFCLFGIKVVDINIVGNNYPVECEFMFKYT